MEFYPEGMNAELDRQFTTPEALRRAMMQGSVLESRVLLCDREHNLHVDLFTPLFATARIAGWCAHRLEELISGGRIMRPAYKSVSNARTYIAPADREVQG